MANTLATGRTYYVRARHKSTSGLLSDWSTTKRFTTTSLVVNAPVFTAPVPAGTSSYGSASFSARTNAFSANGGQSHLSTDWQVSTSATFATNFIDRANDVTNLVTLLVTGLGPSGVYYIRARHRANTGVVSNWTEGVRFVTEGYAVAPMTSLSSAIPAAAQSMTFACAGGGGNWDLNHYATIWEIDKTSSAFNNIYSTQSTTGSEENRYQRITSTFNFDTPYYIRVKKRYAPTGGAGLYETPYIAHTFIIPSPKLEMPSIVNPSFDGATVQASGGSYGFGVSIRVVEGNAVYVNTEMTEWQIFDSGGTLIYNTNTNGTGSTVSVPVALLANNTNYRIRARLTARTAALYQAPSGYVITSPWSQQRTFRAVNA